MRVEQQLQQPDFSPTENFTEQDGIDTANGIIKGVLKVKAHRDLLISILTDTRPLVLDDIDYSDGDSQLVPKSMVADSTVVVRSPDRILPSTAAEKPQFKPVELAPNLKINPISKWDMQAEMNCYIEDINERLATGQSLVESVIYAFGERERNIRAYDDEVIKSKVVLPHLNRFAVVGGRTRIVGSSGRLMVDVVSPEERKGAVLEASVAIENILLAAENNSFAVLMSPNGWNGFMDKNGEQASPHLNTQVQVFWKDATGQLKGLTFHIDLDYDQAKEVMTRLGVSPEALEGETEEDRLVNIVKNPAAACLPATYSNAFEYVLDKILEVRGDGDFRLLQQDTSVEIRTVAEARQGIKRFDQLFLGSRKEEEYLAKLKNYVLGEAGNIREQSVQQKIICQIENTILTLTRIYLQESGKMPILQPSVLAGLRLHPWGVIGNNDGFALERAFLETRAGCPPSEAALRGISLGFSISSEGSISFSGGVTGEYHVGTCGKCGNSNVLVGKCRICTTCEKGLAA